MHKKLLLVIWFLSISSSLCFEVKKTKTININKFKNWKFTVVDGDSCNLYLVISPIKSKISSDSLIVYDSDFKLVLPNTKNYSSAIKNLDETKIDKLFKTNKNISKESNRVKFAETDKNILILNTENEIGLFDLKNNDLKRVKRKVPVKYDNPIVYKDLLIFQDKTNELSVYNFKNNKNVWSVSSGKQGFYYLGIKLGTSDDSFSCYRIDSSHNNVSLFANTFTGCLYKIDLRTGEVLEKKERFKGNSNNAGLITNFDLFDMNGDGIKDIVGPAVDYNIYCISGKDLSIIWEYNTGYEAQMPLSFYDITGDSIPEVFGINDEMKLSILNGKNGEPIYEKVLQKQHYQSKVILADINGNGLLNIITQGGSNDYIRILELPNVNVPQKSIIYLPRW